MKEIKKPARYRTITKQGWPHLFLVFLTLLLYRSMSDRKDLLKGMIEEEIVAELMKLYEELTAHA